MEKVTRNSMAEENWVEDGVEELNYLLDCVIQEQSPKAKDKGDMDLILLDWMLRRTKDWAEVVWWDVFIERFKAYDYTDDEKPDLKVYNFLWAGPTNPVLYVTFGYSCILRYTNIFEPEVYENGWTCPVEFPKGDDLPIYFFKPGKYLIDYRLADEEIYLFEAIWRLQSLFKDITQSLDYEPVWRQKLYDQTFEFINKTFRFKVYPKIEWKKGIRLLVPDGRQINLKLYPNYETSNVQNSMEMTFVNSELYDSDCYSLKAEIIAIKGEVENG